MESQYFTQSKFLDGLGKIVKDTNMLTKEAYDYIHITKGIADCHLEHPENTFLRQKIGQDGPSQENSGNDSCSKYRSDKDEPHFNENVTDISDLEAPLVRKIYSQKPTTTSNERSKKRAFRHFGSAKTANRKSRSVAAPRRGQSGPATIGRSSSSSDEEQEYETQRLISAPDPAPPDNTKASFIRNSKRSPLNRTTKTNKNKKDSEPHAPINIPGDSIRTLTSRGHPRRSKPPNIDLTKNHNISPSLSYAKDDFTNTCIKKDFSNARNRAPLSPVPLHIPITGNDIPDMIVSTSNFLTGNSKSPSFSPSSPHSPHSPRSPITRQRSPRLPPRLLPSPRYPTKPQLSPLPTIQHSPDQSSRASSSSNSNRNNGCNNVSNETLRSPRSPGPATNYGDSPKHSTRLCNTSGSPAVSPTGHLALLASRRRRSSVATHYGGNMHNVSRPSNFLELPGRVSNNHKYEQSNYS